MNNVVPFDFNGLEVRTATDENAEPWFMAKDVCNALDLDNVTRALDGFDEDDLTLLVVTSGGQKREMNFVSEAGLYQLIFKSRKAEAKAFKRWVTKEVLPSIRKTGSYGMVNMQNIVPIVEDVLTRVLRGVSMTPHKRKPGSRLSDEEKDTIDRLSDDYWAYAEMAREIGCDPRTVRNYLNDRDKEEEGMSLFEIEDAT